VATTPNLPEKRFKRLRISYSNQQLIRGLIIRKFVDDYFSQTDKTILSRDSISLPVALSIDENKKSVIITKKLIYFDWAE
jgi:hypothetical protein